MNIECNQPHHLPTHKKFVDGEFIGTEQDFVEYLADAAGGLVNQDESELGNVIERLEPSLPQFVDGKAVWPKGVSEHLKELFENFSTRAGKERLHG